MNKLLLLSASFILAFSSCQKKDTGSFPNQSEDYKKGESLLFKKNDSAFYYFNKVVGSSKDSLEIAMAYNSMAVIQSDASDYFGSQESLLASLKFLDETKENDRWCLAADYNELGITSYNLQHYEQAITYYDQALKFSDDTAFQVTILNNKALVYQKKKDYSGALNLYQRIMPKVNGTGILHARILTNMVKTKWLRNPKYKAAPELLKALQIRIKEEDLWGLNSSYSHLADYYTIARPDSALYYSKIMYAIARRLRSPDDQLEALRKLIKLSPAVAAKKYFSIYQELSDSVSTARNAAKNQFALIRYEAERHKSAILKLQKENTEKEYQAISAVVLLIGVSVSFVFWHKKRKQRLKLEAANAIKENELRVSKKVHDVVANGLYRMMSEIENQEFIDKDDLLDKIEEMYERSRDLSYEKGFGGENFNETIGELIKAFATASTKVLLQGNSKELWEDVAPYVKNEVGHVLQELMVNMRKHSKASNVLVKFGKENGRVQIRYTDDGIGLGRDLVFGNGLLNTGNRIGSISGEITFDRDTARGTSIRISFPEALTEKSYV